MEAYLEVGPEPTLVKMGSLISSKHFSRNVGDEKDMGKWMEHESRWNPVSCFNFYFEPFFQKNKFCRTGIHLFSMETCWKKNQHPRISSAEVNVVSLERHLKRIGHGFIPWSRVKMKI